MQKYKKKRSNEVGKEVVLVCVFESFVVSSLSENKHKQCRNILLKQDILQIATRLGQQSSKKSLEKQLNYPQEP